MSEMEDDDDVQDPRAELEGIEAALCKRNFKRFVYRTWEMIEPTTPIVWNWHLDVICDELQQISDGVNTDEDLLINIPPGTAKSIFTSVLWPSWEWTRKPELRIVSASYGMRLSMRDAMKMRDVVTSAWYVRNFGVQLAEDQAAKPVWVGERVQTREGFKTLGEIAVGDEVLTHLGRFRHVNAIHEQGVIPTLLVTTKKGRTVRAAPDHPFLTDAGWVLAADLVPGTSLVVPLRLEALKKSTEISPEEARLLGYLVGDGCVSRANQVDVVFANLDEEILADFKACAEAVGFFTVEAKRCCVHKMDGCRHTLFLRPSKERWNYNRDGESPLYRWLVKHDLFGKNSYTKRISPHVLSGGEAALANFVGAYWSCDGTICPLKKGGYGQRYSARAGTVSEGLAQDLQLALTSIGIDCDRASRVSRTIRTKEKHQRNGNYTTHYVTVSAQSEIAKLADLPIVERKRKNARAASEYTRGPRGTVRMSIDRDEVVAVRQVEPAECRCLTVDEDSSFTANNLAVHNTWYVNDAGGWRLSTSTGGEGTGEHPDRIIVDDPHKADEARSEVTRQAVIDWWDRTLSTRGVSRGVRRVVVMQRLHEEDLSAHVLGRGGKWRHLMFPMRLDPKRAHPRDPRTKAGELLWPALFPEGRVKQLEIDLGPYGAAGQLQQIPAPEGGGLFKGSWFKYVEEIPARRLRRVRGWDTAATENGGDYTVGVKISHDTDAGIFIVEDVQRGQWGPNDSDATMLSTTKLDGRQCSQREQKEPGSAGAMVIAKRAKDMVGYDYGPSPTTGDKVTRARPYRAQCEAGNVYLKRAPWNAAFVAEHEIFPNGRNDDQVDAASTAFNEVVTGPAPIKTVRAVWG